MKTELPSVARDQRWSFSRLLRVLLPLILVFCHLAGTKLTFAAETEAVRSRQIAPRIEHLEFRSKTLDKTRRLCVVLPGDLDREQQERPFLLLLHGRGRDHYTLINDPVCLERLLQARFVVLLPEGDKGWYIDSPVNSKAKYASYLEEVLSLAESRYGLSRRPAKRALAGWSMGGYGCVRFAETHPGEFASVASVIGLLDYPRPPSGLPAGQSYPIRTKYFGDDPKVWRTLNPMAAAKHLSTVSVLLITADRAFDRTMNERFSKKLKTLRIPHQYKTLKGGHTISVVRDAIPIVIEHTQAVFDEPRKGKKKRSSEAKPRRMTKRAAS